MKVLLSSTLSLCTGFSVIDSFLLLLMQGGTRQKWEVPVSALGTDEKMFLMQRFRLLTYSKKKLFRESNSRRRLRER
jgi:hypothetical protein